MSTFLRAARKAENNEIIVLSISRNVLVLLKQRVDDFNQEKIARKIQNIKNRLEVKLINFYYHFFQATFP